MELLCGFHSYVASSEECSALKPERPEAAEATEGPWAPPTHHQAEADTPHTDSYAAAMLYTHFFTFQDGKVWSNPPVALKWANPNGLAVFEMC